MAANDLYVYESPIFTSKNLYTHNTYPKNLIKTPWGDWNLSTSYMDDNYDEEFFDILISPETHTATKMKITVELYGGINALNYLIGAKEAKNDYENSRSYSVWIDAKPDEYIKEYRLKIYFQSIDPQEPSQVSRQVTLPLLGSVVDYLSKSFASKSHADVIIKTSDGNEIGANKFILSRSPVFNAMLNVHDTKEAQEGIIEINDFTHEVITEMVRFLYSDEVPKLKEMALDLMIAANKYDIPELFEICKHYLKANITTESLVDILGFAESLKLDDLKDIVMQHIIKNSEKVFSSPEWKLFEEQNMQIAMNVMKDCVAKMNGNRR